MKVFARARALNALKVFDTRKKVFVTPKQVADDIRKYRQECDLGKYLDCVTGYSTAHRLCMEIARVLKLPEVADPDDFVDYYDEQQFLGEREDKTDETSD